MAQVIPMAEFQARKNQEVGELLMERLNAPPKIRPRIRDGDIWTKDYSLFDDQLQAIIKIREVLDYHLHYSEEWKHYLLSVLDQVYQGGGAARAGKFAQTIALFKGFLAEELNVTNRRDLILVMLLLELMDKGFAQGAPRREQEQAARG